MGLSHRQPAIPSVDLHARDDGGPHETSAVERAIIAVALPQRTLSVSL
jgi:hypothetical protein